MTLTIDSDVKQKLSDELKNRDIKISHFVEAKIIKAMKEEDYAIV